MQSLKLIGAIVGFFLAQNTLAAQQDRESLDSEKKITSRSEEQKKAAFQVLPSALSLLKEIKSDGSLSVSNRLTPNYKLWSDLIENVSSGDKDWLQVARSLLGVSEGGNTQMIIGAMSRALHESPENVLELINNGFSADVVCVESMLLEEGMAELAIKELKTTEELLQKVNSNDLKKSRDACLERIRKQIKKYESVKK